MCIRDSFETISGTGIIGTIDHEIVLLGNMALLQQYNISIPDSLKQKIKENEDQAKTISFLANGTRVVGMLIFSDNIKESSKKAIQFLQMNKVEVIMMTGDNEHTAKAVAKELGIKKYFANCLPQDKLAEIKRLQAEGKIVAMTGDGINDAPALACLLYTSRCV